MVGWPQRLDGHEFEQAPGVGDKQGVLARCSPWGRKESDRAQKMQAAFSNAPRGLLWRRKILTLYCRHEASGWPRGTPVQLFAIKYLYGLKKLMHLSNCLQEKKRIIA